MKMPNFPLIKYLPVQVSTKVLPMEEILQEENLVEIFLSTREESIILMKVFRNFGFSSK
jgi:hypothetical protein